ncbi:MAG: class I SAM-dependent methyltransferase [Gammaproteobacteria bacterium]|nr:class I SAM-dependent methyltransferase [Gammaproteobacteria bacterium]
MNMDLYQKIEQQLKLEKGIPFTPDWSAAPDFIELIVEHALTTKPQVIVECSSGLTTLVLARCCQMSGRGHVYSLENGPEYAAKTRSYFERYGVDDYVTVIDAPLESVTINGTDYQWYRTTELFEQLPADSIEMLVIDGPPGFIQKNSRYPALPQLEEKIADHCTVFLDDAAREDEREIVQLWQNELRGIESRYIDAERGCAVLTMTRALV